MMTSPLPLTSHLFQVTVACAPPPNPSHRYHYPPPLLLPFPISFTSLFSVFSSPSPMGFTLRHSTFKYQCMGCSKQSNAVFSPPINYGSFCVQPENVSAANFCFSNENKLNKPYYAARLNCSGWSYRSIIARSDLAQGGIPDHSISEVNFKGKARGVCFYAVTAINAVFLFVLMLIGHPFVLMLDPYRRKFQHFVAKVWAGLSIAPFYKVQFVGLEHLPGPDVAAVYVSNHQPSIGTKESCVAEKQVMAPSATLTHAYLLRFIKRSTSIDPKLLQLDQRAQGCLWNLGASDKVKDGS